MNKVNKRIAVGVIIGTVASTIFSFCLAETLIESKNVNNVQTAIDGTCTKFSNQLTTLKQEIINEIYPVGSIYISTTLKTTTDVQNKFGGTWEVYGKGQTLVGNDGTTYITGDNSKGQGGSTTASTKLTVANLPSHSHVIPELSATTSNNGAHHHDFSVYTNNDTAVTVPANTNFLNKTVLLYSTTAHTGGLHGLHGKMSDSGAHTHTVTIPSTNTTTCTNCTGTAFTTSTMQPYTVVYMYKRTK